jgi:hypothetical protein
MKHLKTVGLSLGLLAGARAEEAKYISETPLKVQDLLGGAPLPSIETTLRTKSKIFFVKKDLTLVEKHENMSFDGFEFVLRISNYLGGKITFPTRVLLKPIHSTDIRTITVASRQELTDLLRKAVQ